MTRTMKDSGIEWIGEIPEDWEIHRNKVVFSCNKEIVGENSNNIQLLSLTTGGVKTKDINSVGGKLPESFDTYQYVAIDNIIMCLFDLDMSAVFSGISNYNGMISPAYKVLKCNNNYIIPKYADYWFKFVFVDRKFATYAKNLRYTLSYDEFGVLSIPIPSLPEQQKIADFLDEKCSHIDSILEKTKASIDECKQLKQSVITQAVTKGIRPNRPMKDSGIEWIGQIPKDWEAATLKHYITWKSKKGCPDETVLSLYRDYGVIPKDSRDDNHNVTSIDTSDYKVVDVGDFVINKMKAWQGSMAISKYRGIISPAYHICTVNSTNIDLMYFHYLLRNKSYLPEYTRLSTGMRVGQWDLSFDDFKNIPFIIPPMNEQIEIVGYLDNKCSEIDKLITKKEKLIEELETYKKSLIYEYVTGKKEVI